MPIYEYECDSCGNRFEKIQRFSDEPLTLHEGCGGRVARLISSPAFHFKGTGWYVTDYAKTNGQTPPPKDASEGKKEEKSGEKAEKKEAADKKAESSDRKKAEASDRKKSEGVKSEAPAAPAAAPAASNGTSNSSDKK